MLVCDYIVEQIRYEQHFARPIIHEQDMRHEELLGVYPEDWCSLVEKICL